MRAKQLNRNNLLVHYLLKHIHVLGCALLLIAFPPLALSQKLASRDRERGHFILKRVKEDLERYYYDPTFHGLPMAALFAEADILIDKAETNNDIWATIAGVLMLLNDSHTKFYPPRRMALTNYGWEMQMVGDKCFVVFIEPGTDAAKKLSIGDQVLSVGEKTPTRDNLWVLNYLYDFLRPMSGKAVIVRKASGEQVRLDVMADVRERKLLEVTNPNDLFENEEASLEARKYDVLHRHRFNEIGTELIIWKMPQFDLSQGEVDSKMEKIRKHNALILDLRGNRGGSEETLIRLLSHFFDHDVKIGDIKQRSDTKELTVKSRGKASYRGKLIVLVDSNSASASELFAKTIQVENRGTIVGDNTAGAVMRSVFYSGDGFGSFRGYGLSITVSDLILAGSARLEHVGVKPDVMLLPSPEDMAMQRDPILSKAASLLGIKIESDRAGRIFPIEWNKIK
jgi:C-terminal processing protease CtpA/Prc